MEDPYTSKLALIDPINITETEKFNSLEVLGLNIRS